MNDWKRERGARGREKGCEILGEIWRSSSSFRSNGGFSFPPRRFLSFNLVIYIHRRLPIIRHRFSAKANHIRWPKAYLNLWIASLSLLSRYSKNFPPRVHFFLFSHFLRQPFRIISPFVLPVLSILAASNNRDTFKLRSLQLTIQSLFPLSATTVFFFPFFT